MGARSVTTICWTDMGKSKHDFVHFINAAISNKHGLEAHELHKFLNKVFIDNDYDFDGLVGRIGFDQMIKEAAHAPRRFGFAPHASEMYDTKQDEEEAHSKLFDQLCKGRDGISFENWYQWSMNHIIAKDQNLVEHAGGRWSRSPADFVSFFKGVAKATSSYHIESTTSTQYKEFYLLTNRHFIEADTENLGYLTEPGFDKILHLADKIPRRFGHHWYKGVKFSDVAVDGKISWARWLQYNSSLVKKAAYTQL